MPRSQHPVRRESLRPPPLERDRVAFNWLGVVNPRRGTGLAGRHHSRREENAGS